VIKSWNRLWIRVGRASSQSLGRAGAFTESSLWASIRPQVL